MNSRPGVSTARSVSVFVVILPLTSPGWKRIFSSSVCYPSFFFSALMTVVGLTWSTRAVSRMPLAFIAISRIGCLTPGCVTGVRVIHQKRAPFAGVFLAAIALLPLARCAMSDDIGPLAVRAMQDLHDHDVTRLG